MPRYALDHFVFVRRTALFDPEVQYNRGEKITEEAKQFLLRVKPGDTLLIKEVYALNVGSPDAGLVKLPEKIFILQ